MYGLIMSMIWSCLPTKEISLIFEAINTLKGCYLNGRAHALQEGGCQLDSFVYHHKLINDIVMHFLNILPIDIN